MAAVPATMSARPARPRGVSFSWNTRKANRTEIKMDSLSIYTTTLT